MTITITKEKLIMNKKNYITPTAKEVTLLAMQMMATSTVRISNQETDADARMSNSRRDGWGDPWSE